MERPELLTGREVADRLRVSTVTVYRWAQSINGEPPVLPCVYIGGIRRWRAVDVERLLATDTEAAS